MELKLNKTSLLIIALELNDLKEALEVAGDKATVISADSEIPQYTKIAIEGNKNIYQIPTVLLPFVCSNQKMNGT